MTAPVTSLTINVHGNSMLVSTLDSTLRLLDRSNGKLLKTYSHPDHAQTSYRIRSTLGSNDALVVAGSENGYINAWDIVSGELVGTVRHNAEQAADVRSSRKVVSTVAYHSRSDEWASAGGDGTVVIWGLDT